MVRLEYAYGVCPKCKVNNYLRYIIHNDGLVHKPYEIKCLNCNSYFKKEDIFGSGEETTPKPITNADRVRSMSDEELAEWLSCNCTGDGYGNSSEDWLDWLREEASDG